MATMACEHKKAISRQLEDSLLTYRDLIIMTLKRGKTSSMIGDDVEETVEETGQKD